MEFRYWLLAALWALCAACGPALAGEPRLTMTAAEAAYLRQSAGESPSFARSLERARQRVEAHFAGEVAVPRPRDAGGGYTHETHKRNAVAIHDAGYVYLLTGDARHAERAAALLLRYAEMYPTLGEHPQRKEQTPGRLFWQSLNESVWLVYAIQGYDAIRATLDAGDARRIESRLLRPMARFLSEESPETFNRIHNHGAWAAAAVGMTGYALDEPRYVGRALHGLAEDGEAGLFRQMDRLFSPDGYYTEGPYYQRYALMPFVLLARSVQANDPELEIFRYRDSILLRAILACIDLSYAGLFFPLNDAIKDKGLDTVELRHGLALAYALTGDASLLSVAAAQRSHVLTADGFKLARAVDSGQARPYDFRSVLLRDGPQGKRGAVAVLREGAGAKHQALVFKASSQGMGHGHFDRLHWLYYDNGEEIVQDYGAARFLNVEQKQGGRYLPENSSWAKQTVAHNTLVVDERSHFEGKQGEAARHDPKVLFFDSNSELRIVAALMRGAYEDVAFSRTQALVNGVVPGRAVVVDVLNAGSRKAHQYDLPLHFNGHLIATSHALRGNQTRLAPLGDASGYQHLWLRGGAQLAAGEQFSMTWLRGGRFYSWTTLAAARAEALLAELGANDPDFNLRRERALILRVPRAKSHSFVSVLEPHGGYDGAEESTFGNFPRVEKIERYSEGGADVIRLATRDGGATLLGLSYNPDAAAGHRVAVGGRVLSWRGYYHLERVRAGETIQPGERTEPEDT